MLVKVRDTLYDSREEPVMVILSPEERALIENMHQEATQFCSYPEAMSESEICAFMDIGQFEGTVN